jgi:hypothetical protein
MCVGFVIVSSIHLQSFFSSSFPNCLEFWFGVHDYPATGVPVLALVCLDVHTESVDIIRYSIILACGRVV